MDASLLRDLIAAIVGVATGVLSALFGIGGAVLSTPAIRLLGASPVDAIGSTIPSILPSAAVSSWVYTREKLVDWRVARWAGIAGVAFAVIGARLTSVIPGDGHMQQVLTAALLGFTAWRLLRGTRRTNPAPEQDPDQWDAGGPTLAVIGAVAGLVAGMLGVGGGIVMVPAFTEILRMPIKRVTATSLVVVALLAVPSMVTHALLGNIDWRLALWLTIGVIPGARLGSHISLGTKDRTLRVLVGCLFLILGAIYGATELILLRG